MAESNLTADVAAISWAGAAGAAARDRTQEEKGKAHKTRKQTFLNTPDADVVTDEQPPSEGTHEIDSFA